MKNLLYTLLMLTSYQMSFAQDSFTENLPFDEEKSNVSEACNPNHIYMKVDESPSYRGGMDQLESDLKENVVFDKSVNGIFYTVVMLNCNNAVYSIHKLHGINKEVDDKILSEMNSLQNWTSGSQNGDTVDCSIGLTMTFKKGKMTRMEYPSK